MNVMKKEVIEYDKLVILSDDGTADIANVYDRNDDSIFAESKNYDYAVPLADLKVHVGAIGRVYTLAADRDYIHDTIRLAALEKSIVLRHVTQFEKPQALDNGKMSIKQMLLFALVGVLLLAVIFK